MSPRKASALIAAVALAGVTAIAARSTSGQARPPADLVLTNGRIVTVEPGVPDAQALAIVGERIAALDTSEDIKRHIGPATRVIDLAGRLVIPGFVEGHGHFTGIGTAKLNLNLMKTSSWDQIVAMVAEAVKKAKPGEWIYGRGWHQEKWTSRPEPHIEGFPTHDSLSRVSPGNPVVLTHASGHATFVNARAMELSGITAKTPDPEGGDILKDAAGNPTGLLRETASRLIRRGAGEPHPTPAEEAARARRVLELASEEVLSKGVTSFQDAGSTFDEVDLMKQMIDEGRIGVRLWIMLRTDNQTLAANLAKYRTVDYASGFLTVRGIKKSIDGALGPRGAWLLEPYADKPGDTGHNTTPVEEVREAARLALQYGYQMCVHAIGDRANRETLDIFEAAFRGAPDRADLRWRIEHAQHLHPSDIARFGKLGVIASMQGVHCTSDAPYVTARLGPRRAEEGAYVWQKLMAAGAVVTNGTDAPVEDVDPIASFYATVTRKLADGRVFYPDQRMSRMEALKSYTWNGAYAAFEEASRGSLKAGKYADLVVLSKDILSVPEDEIPTAEVLYTIVGGKIRYRYGGQVLQ
ncbi:MAG TPA: amidohydrolase [Vicinamibacterales bacterium]|nr:amidohydrolase [Vicinamibacterales bacterium]